MNLLRAYGPELACGAVILLYFSFVWHFAIDVPVGDDYNDGVLGFVCDWVEADGFAQRMQKLFALHNEHRISWTRLMLLATYGLTGEANFVWMTLLGNLALLLSAIVIVKMLELQREKALFLVLCLVLFQPQPNKIIFYPMSLVQAYWAMLFSLLFLRCLMQGKSWPLGFVFYALATYTTGAGVVVGILALPLLIHKKKYLRLGVVVAVALALAYLYFSDFPPDKLPRSSDLTEKPFLTLNSFIQLTGASAELLYVPQFGTYLLAATILGFFGWLTIKQDFREHPGLYVLMLYLLMTCVLVAVGRTSGDYERMQRVVLDGRYRIYSNILLAVLLVNLPRIFPRGGGKFSIKGIIIIFACLFSLYSYAIKIRISDATKAMRAEGMNEWVRTGNSEQLDTWAVPRAIAEKNLKRAAELGVYAPKSFE